MELDDDMYVVIIGDGENPVYSSENLDVNKYDPEANKQEFQDCVEDLIDTAERHGQMIEGEFPTFNKLEPLDDDDDYAPNFKDDINSTEESDDENWTKPPKTKAEISKPQRRKMLSPWECKSFINDLRTQYPELEESEELLIDTLVEIMSNVKTPDLPEDFYQMNDTMFECSKCGHWAETLPAASRHYQEKHGQRYLVCFACGVDFRSTSNLYKHEMRCTVADAVVLLKARARWLGRKGRSRPYLPDLSNMPKQSAKHEKRCTVTDAMVLLKARARWLGREAYLPDLSKMPKPNAQARFLCDLCGSRFVSLPALEAHANRHAGARPHLCSHCPAAYPSARSLQRHWFTKHSDVEYICDHCKRSFKEKSGLVVHMDMHLPVKKFGCEECSNRYTKKAALVLHVDTVHRRLPPQCVCQICDMKYRKMYLLKKHMIRKHGMTLMTQRMFYKSLPTMTDTQLKKAKVILNSDRNTTPTVIEPYVADVAEYAESTEELEEGEIPPTEELPESAEEPPESAEEGEPLYAEDVINVSSDQVVYYKDIQEVDNSEMEATVKAIIEKQKRILARKGKQLKKKPNKKPRRGGRRSK